MAQPEVGEVKAPIVPPPAPYSQPSEQSFGGTLNATTAEAEKAAVEKKQRDQQASGAVVASQSDEVSEIAALEAARSAVEDASASTGFSPANQPAASLHTQPIIEAAGSPVESVAEEATPIDDFMQSHQQNQVPIAPHAIAGDPPQLSIDPPSSVSSHIAGPPTSLQPAMPGGAPPPLPPMPPAGGVGAMPPMPPMPGQAIEPAGVSVQPQIVPGFMNDVSQTQNHWTSAGEDMSQKYSERNTSRQARKDEIAQQYDNALEQNKALQEKAKIQAQSEVGSPQQVQNK